MENERLKQLEAVCAGLSQDAIDGGFTVAGLQAYCRRLETITQGVLMAVFNSSGEGAQLAARCREMIAQAEDKQRCRGDCGLQPPCPDCWTSLVEY